jgi:hypothetical protein
MIENLKNFFTTKAASVFALRELIKFLSIGMIKT